MVTWATEELNQISERVSSLEEFFSRNYLTLLHDTASDNPQRKTLLDSIAGLHGILDRMIKAEAGESL